MTTPTEIESSACPRGRARRKGDVDPLHSGPCAYLEESDKDGALRHQGVLLDGVPHGLWRFYWDNGIPKRVGRFERERNVRARSFYRRMGALDPDFNTGDYGTGAEETERLVQPPLLPGAQEVQLTRLPTNTDLSVDSIGGYLAALLEGLARLVEVLHPLMETGLNGMVSIAWSEDLGRSRQAPPLAFQARRTLHSGDGGARGTRTKPELLGRPVADLALRRDRLGPGYTARLLLL